MGEGKTEEGKTEEGKELDIIVIDPNPKSMHLKRRY
jgi:hypothetical protein